MRSVRWRVIGEDGSSELVASLLEFCRVRNLQYYDCVAVANGKQSSHKGWRIERLGDRVAEVDYLNPFLALEPEEPIQPATLDELNLVVATLRGQIAEIKARVAHLERPRSQAGPVPSLREIVQGCSVSGQFASIQSGWLPPEVFQALCVVMWRVGGKWSAVHHAFVFKGDPAACLELAVAALRAGKWPSSVPQAVNGVASDSEAALPPWL